MFCPLCQSEYREGFARCADCDVELVETLDQWRADEGEAESGAASAVRLWRGADPVTYTALVGALRDTGIPFYDNAARDFENQLSAKFTRPKDYGVPNFDIRVRQEDYESAQLLVEEVLAQLVGEPLGEPDAEPSSTSISEVPERIPSSADPMDASIELWAGKDADLVQFLIHTLHENDIFVRKDEDSSGCVLLFVPPQDESRAREILREITEGAPPA